MTQGDAVLLMGSHEYAPAERSGLWPRFAGLTPFHLWQYVSEAAILFPFCPWLINIAQHLVWVDDSIASPMQAGPS